MVFALGQLSARKTGAKTRRKQANEEAGESTLGVSRRIQLAVRASFGWHRWPLWSRSFLKEGEAGILAIRFRGWMGSRWCRLGRWLHSKNLI